MKKEIRLAVLDLGSNSVRMEIYQIFSDGSYKSIQKEKRLVCLSEKMGKEKKLRPVPIRRTLEALKEFKKFLEIICVHEVRALATEAVRRASNRMEFLRQVKKETGFVFHVISGREEAYYDCLGVDFSLHMNRYMMIDTGGGSVEIALVIRGKMIHSASLPMGSVILSEKWGLSGKLSVEKCFHVMMDVARTLQKIPWIRKGRGLPVVMLGGANRMLGRIHMMKYNPGRKSLHNYSINIYDILRMYRRMLNTNTEQRKAVPGMEEERADIIIGGLTPLVVLLLDLESERATVCLEGLRMGVFREFYRELQKTDFFSFPFG